MIQIKQLNDNDIVRIQKYYLHVMTLIDTGALQTKKGKVVISFNADNVITNIEIQSNAYKRRKI